MVAVGPPLSCKPFGLSPAGTPFRSPACVKNAAHDLSSDTLLPADTISLLKYV